MAQIEFQTFSTCHPVTSLGKFDPRHISAAQQQIIDRDTTVMSAVGTIVPDDPHITHAIVSGEPSHGTAAWFLYAHGYIIIDDTDISYMIEEAALDSNKATI